MHRVRARNLAGDTENRIHEDTVARRHGFAGGLVAGITTYAYMTRPATARWGSEWLHGGALRARLEAPVYDGDEIEIRSTLHGVGGDDSTMAVRVVNADGVVCARAEASRGHTTDFAGFGGPGADPPSDRPPATAEELSRAGVLGARPRTFRSPRAAEFLNAIDDPEPLFRGGPAHPGWLVYDANQVLAQNFLMGPWIHVATDAHHFGVALDGDVVSMCGRVAGLFEKRGHEFVELDLVSTAARGDVEVPLARFRHTAIYRLASP